MQERSYNCFASFSSTQVGERAKRSFPAFLMGNNGWYSPRNTWNLHWMRPNVIQTTFSWICHVIFCLHVWMTCRTGLCFADEWVEGVEKILMNLLSLSSFTMGDNGFGSSTKKAPRCFNRLMMSNFSAHDCNTLSSCFTFTPLTFPHLHHYVSGCSQGASTDLLSNLGKKNSCTVRVD